MLTKNEIKDIQSLHHKKHRDEQKLFIAEGPKLVQELLNSSYTINHIYATQTWVTNNPGLPVSVTQISTAELSRISQLQAPNEVLLVAEQQLPKDDLVFKGRLTLALDGIRDPGNMGTIIRIADWFGIQQIICSNDCVEIYNPKVVQATMGSLTRVSCFYQDFNTWNTEPGVPIFGAVLNGKNLYQLPKIDEGILVIGNESKGIREPLLSKITQPITIPKAGAAESLNAAVATGIIVGAMVNGR